MRWSSAISRHPNTDLALEEAITQARSGLGDGAVDWVLCFFSPEHAPAAGEVAKHLAGQFPAAVVSGCSARSCIGDGVEVEEGPSLSLTLASLPGVVLHPFHASADDLAMGVDPIAHWRRVSGVEPDEQPAFVLLGDPWSGDVEAVIRGFDAAYPGAVLVGGLASGGQQPGEDVLLHGDGALSSGLVGVALTGDVVVEAIVAQGCRPIGQPMFVTRSDQNWIFEVDGRPPFEVLNELAEQASERELQLFQTSLFVGIQMDPDQMELGRGDFLVRNVLGGDPDSGALAVGATVEDTMVVQFQLRDGETAAEDLDARLRGHANEGATGALLFSCLGRGRGMYGSSNHDSDALRRHLGDVSVSGFFCNGEIGPVQGQTFLHGYTSAFGVFRPKH